VRLSTAIRAGAAAALAAGVAAPLVRRRLDLPAPAVIAAAASAPFALCVLVPRSRTRDVGMCALQMWAYLATYKMPNDDPEALERRVKVAYPVTIDRFLGGGTTPTLRLQRLLGRPGRFQPWEKVLVVSHWIWFAFPHGTVAYLVLRHPERFAKGATQMYATFDLGLVGYWAIPTAPPWYAAQKGLMDDGLTPELRRMMVEYGEHFWGSGWGPLYGLLGGNPLAAMPSLHFATSVMAAHLLAETGPVAGALGWAYASTLGLALVYLGEHYVTDLAAGLALTEGVRLAAPTMRPLLMRVSAAVQALEARARA
jgi:membrane-associated phospholipid phosphatase